MTALEAFLRRHGLGGPVTSVRRIGDGHSNLTYLVRAGAERVVLRRPPPPPVPPGAHDVLREARLLKALSRTGVPVARVLAVAEAGEVFDVPCYVMSYVEGPVVTAATPTPLATPTERRRIAESLVDTLAAVHAVDWRAVGLDDFGRPDGFNARHLRRIGRLVPSDATFTAIASWLSANVPAESGAAIVHNDFRIGNTILAPQPPGRVTAVLDWELATIGDPLWDVGYFLASYPAPDEALTPTAAFATAVLEAGYPSRAELAGRYAAATGRDLSNLSWYTVAALWKLAVLYEYSRRQGRDPYYRDPALVRSFLTAAQAAMV